MFEPMSLASENRCPVCSRVVTDPDEMIFLEFSGECDRCDHLRGEVYEEN